VMLWLRRLSKDETGVAMVLVVMSMVVILGCAALAVDVGNLYRVRRELVTAADAGALAGAYVWDWKTPNTPTVEQEARDIAEQNSPLGAADASTTVNGGDVAVRVVVRQDVPLYFARVFGLGSYEVAAAATAVNQAGTPEQGMLFPIAIHDPRYTPPTMGGKLCGETDGLDTDQIADMEAYCHKWFDSYDGGHWDFSNDDPEDILLDPDFWEAVDPMDGFAPNGYIELHHDKDKDEFNTYGNFSALNLPTGPAENDTCGKWNLQSTAKYTCQLTYGGWVTNLNTVWANTEPGNMASATFEGVRGGSIAHIPSLPGRMGVAREVLSEQPDCTPATIAETPGGGLSVVGTKVDGCPLIVAAPVVKEWPTGTSVDTHITAWVSIGIINACDLPGIAHGDVPPTDAAFAAGNYETAECHEGSDRAVIYVKFMGDVNVTHFVPNPTGASSFRGIKLIE